MRSYGDGPPRAARSCVADLNVLLVSRGASWAEAVGSATRDIEGAGVSICGAGAALTRLARGSPHYSHVLVEARDADGLVQALADLTSEIADPGTELLMLGDPLPARPLLRAIPAAEAEAVRRALMTTRAKPRADQGLSLCDLRAALDGGMIEPRYQPIIRMSDRYPIGLEALARINHPAVGVLLPNQFVPRLENAGLAGQLTDCVSARVFADMQGPALAGPGLRVSVNFPLDVLLRPAALDRLERQRAAAGIPAARIIIELTESQPPDDMVPLRRAVEHLRRLGYGVAIDDVGPAIPRLAPLLDLPFSSLKLDKDLVAQVIRSPGTEAFVAATIAQARQRGLTVVAEGVETEQLWARMFALGAHEAQGLLAARPLPLTALPVWLEAWNAEPDRFA